MNSRTSIRIIHALSLSLLVVVGLSVVGCDSGGSNGGGGEESGTVTAEVTGGETTGSISVNFTYATDGGTCSEVAFDENFETPGNKDFDPETISFRCDVDDPNQWDETEVTFSPDGSADGLTLTLTSGGGEIASTSSSNDNGNLVATAGSVDES